MTVVRRTNGARTVRKLEKLDNNQPVRRTPSIPVQSRYTITFPVTDVECTLDIAHITLPKP